VRVAFISANQETTPDAVIPLGLLHVMAATPDRHEKLFWDLCFDPSPLESVARNLRAHQPDVVAIGLRNLQNMDYTNIEANVARYRELVRTVRRHSTAPIVLGGGGFTVAARALMEDLGADFGITGEGEESFPQLLDALECQPTALDHIARLYHRRDGELVLTGHGATFLDVNAYPQPSRAPVDERYYAGYGIESLQTKRGCALHCDYCTYPLIEGNRSRMREPARVADDFMTLCERPGVEHVFIVDSVFNLPLRHAKQVCRELVARGNRMPWTSYVGPIAFDGELAELMVAAGATGAEIGSDSGCDDVLDRLRKGFRTDRIRGLSSLSKAVGLKDCHSFILGTRGETLDDVRRTLDFIEELQPFAAVLLVWVEDSEVIDTQIERQRRQFRDSIYELIGSRASRQPRWIVPRLGIRFDPRRFKVLRQYGLRGPLWQYIDRAPHT